MLSLQDDLIDTNGRWQSWRGRAACRDADTNLFFPAGETGEAEAQIVEAKAICATCPVREQCLEFAISSNQRDGIWGGLDETERRRVRRRRQAARRVS
jgi:WhiB family redox-sensing transcriptional regulator